MSSRILVAQGGGPTAVINQSLAGVVLEARRQVPDIQVYGALHGVRGIVDEDFVDLTQETVANLERVAATPAAALGSTRDKPDLAYCQEIFKVLAAHGIGHFFYIGGNDSADTVRIVAEQAAAAGYPLRAMHVPKTIDNDLVGNDHTPGFPSAARFVVQAYAGANLDNAALPGVYVGVVMGRHAGFLTAAAALARKFPDDGPHLVYLPERVFEVPRFLADVKATYERHGRCVVAVSEGVSTADGRALVESLVPAERLERDQHGNVKLSGSDLTAALERALASGLPGKRARVDALGYMPRGAIAAINEVDAGEAFEAGAFAVQVAAEGGGSVALQYDGARTVLRKVPLENVAGKTRHMPDAFLLPDANALSETGLAYFRRLVPQKYKVGRPFV